MIWFGSYFMVPKQKLLFAKLSMKVFCPRWQVLPQEQRMDMAPILRVMLTTVYSNHYASTTPGGLKRLIVAKVFVGQWVVGSTSNRAPQVKPGEELKRFDSTVNHHGNPSIFDIFDNCQAFPKYVVTYTM